MQGHGRIARRTVLKGLGAGAALSIGAGSARAATYPTRPITIIVPYGPGGTVDTYTRALTALVAPHLSGRFVVENKPGAGGAMGAILMKTTRPDGYTVTLGTEGLLRLPYLERVAFEVEDGFTYICGLSAFNFGVAVRKDSPIQTFEQFIDEGRKNPGKLTYSAGLANTTMPLMMAQVAQKTGARYLHTPFRSGTEMLTAVLGGHVDAILDSTGGFAPQVDSGDLRLLATFGDTRSLRWPHIATARELGVDVTGVLYFGLIGPKGMDEAVVEALHQAFRKAMEEEQHKTSLKQLDTLPWYQPPAEFKRIFLAKYKEYGALFESLGMRRN